MVFEGSSHGILGLLELRTQMMAVGRGVRNETDHEVTSVSAGGLRVDGERDTAVGVGQR